MSHAQPDERTDRILDAALELAEADGYEAVRLRDLAERAEVALGTVYRRFASKEDILAAVLEREVNRLYGVINAYGVPGESPLERLESFFEMATQILAGRPKLAAAMLRTVASGDPVLSETVTRYYDRVVEILVVVARGAAIEAPITPDEALVARLLQNIWFGGLVGWTGGLHDHTFVITLTRDATRLLLAGQGRA